MLSPTQASIYRRLTIGDTGLLSSLLSSTPQDVPGLEQELDAGTRALVRLAALIAAGGNRTAYHRAVQAALEHGATPEQVTRVLVASAPIVGSAHVMTAAPRLALALGYDVDAGLEDPATAE